MRVKTGKIHVDLSSSPAAVTYPTFQKGSAFGGEFVIPFAHVDGKQTLTLQFDKRKMEIRLEAGK